MSSKQPSRSKSRGVGMAVGFLLGLLVKDLGLNVLVSYWGDLTLWIVAAALIGAVVWPTRLRWVFGGTTVCLGIFWLIIAFTPLTAWMARDLPRRDPVRPADAIFVLGSKIQMDGELTTEAMSRLLHGIELLAEGHAPRLIVSELHPPIPSYEVATRALLESLRLDQELLAVGPVGNTHDEAVAVGALFRKQGWQKLLLVTAPSHSRRASAAFEKEGMEVISSPAVQTRFNFERLVYFHDRLDAFRSLGHEWLGLWVYRRRGWID